MGHPIKRYPEGRYIPITDEMVQVVEKVIAEHGGIRPTAKYMTARYAGQKIMIDADSWVKQIQRIIYRKTEKVNPGFIEKFYKEARVRMPPPKYRQKVWRVSYTRVWYGGEGNPRKGEHLVIENDYYIREKSAVKRRDQMLKAGRLVDWAVCYACWEELPYAD